MAGRKPIKTKQAVKKAHSALGASSCERWWNCPGSIHLSKDAKPSPPAFYAVEGTVAHALASDYLLGAAKHPWDRIGEVVTEQGMEIVVDDSMAEAVTTYIDLIEGLIAEHGLQKEHVFIEQRIQIPIPEDINNSLGEDTLFGTADSILLVPFDRIIVADYKHGVGVTVDVEGNKQLLYYALGAFLAMPESMREEISYVELIICQPRSASSFATLKRTTITVDELFAHYDELLKAVERIKPGADLVPGDHCRFCPAKPNCPALRSLAVQEAQSDFSDVNLPAVRRADLPAPEQLPPEVIARILDHQPIIEDWLSAVKEFALEQIRSGVKIPGYTLTPRRVHRKWVSEKDAAAVLEPVLKAEAFTKPKLISPAQAEKLLKKSDVSLEGLIFKPEAGLTLVKGKEDDILTLALEDFSEVTT